MWLINSSIGRKVVMSVTGIALILFLTFHACMNVVALFSARGYNMICEFLGANWYALVATVALAVLMVLHFCFAIWITLQNRRARGDNRYAVTDKPEKVEWASQNMLVLGIIVVLGLLLHLYNFWYNMMFAELAGVENVISPTNGVEFIARTFSCPIYTIIYMVWLVAIWMHLNHGMWSSMQTLGWNGKVWFCRWRVISTIYTTIIMLMFAAVALAFSFGYRPADYGGLVKAGCRQCPQEMKAPGVCCSRCIQCCGADCRCGEECCGKPDCCCKGNPKHGSSKCGSPKYGCSKFGVPKHGNPKHGKPGTQHRPKGHSPKK